MPLSLGSGQVVQLGNQPINLRATAYYNAIKPADAATWTVKLQFQFLFSK